MANQTDISWNDFEHLYARVNQEIIEMEERNDLLRFQVEKWCVWPLMRFSVGELLQGLERSSNKVRRNYLNLTSTAILDFCKVLTSGKREVAVRVYDSNLSEKRGDTYIDIFFDDLLADIGSSFKIEVLSNPVFSEARRSAKIRSDVTSTFLDIIANIASRSFHSQYIHQISKEISLILRKERKLSGFTPEYIYSVISKFHWSLKLYEWLFERICSRYLLTLTAYCDHAIVAAAKSKGVEVIEFQHGYIAPWHIGYSWSKYAKPYKQNMPIPDRIFLYGDYWRQALVGGGFWDDDELRVVGNLRMDYHRHIRPSKPNDVIRLLLTTQPVDIDNIIAFMVQFLEEYTDMPPFELYIKLHPGETDKTRYERLFGSFKNVKVLRSVEMPSTFEILRSSHVHISVSSTCHYEALALGVPTVILPLWGYENVVSLERCNYAFLVEKPRDLVNLIANLKEMTVPPDIGNILFANNALHNMKAELNL